jgi:hypothetical protein
MRRVLFCTISVLLLAAGVFLTATATADAHERRTVGSVNFVVGFLNEPALLNEPNAVDLRVSRGADATPVTGLETTLKVEVMNGGQKTEVALKPRFNVPGAYDGRFLPTKAGVYAFRFFGTIEGAQVNETFTSSATTFSSVEEPNSFPEKLVSNQQLAESMAGIEERIVDLDSGGDADTALIVAIVGVVLGALGLAVGGYSLTRRSA